VKVVAVVEIKERFPGKGDEEEGEDDGGGEGVVWWCMEVGVCVYVCMCECIYW
jgi:hypothetical protein